MKISLSLLGVAVLFAALAALLPYLANSPPEVTPALSVLPSFSPAPTPTITPSPKPMYKVLEGGTHSFQTFNNCGPASLSMALSLLDVNVSQKTLGDALRPYQVPGGNNDDKSVVLEELAKKGEEYGFLAYHRPAGDISLLTEFIANDIPVITRTLLETTSDIGHYRVVKGYNDQTRQLLQDDSLQGANLWYTYTEFSDLWDTYGYEYLVLVPPQKRQIAEQILGNHLDKTTAWREAVALAETKLAQNPSDTTAKLNASVAHYHLGNYEESVRYYEEIENLLTFRTLWYQNEPILAYYKLGDYTRALEITDQVLGYHNRAYSELYHVRAIIFEKQGNLALAQSEREKILQYNVHYFENAPLDL